MAMNNLSVDPQAALTIFDSALQFVDNALNSAVEANSKTSKEADKAFAWANDVLFAFRDNFPFNDSASDKKWEEAVTRVMIIPPTNDRSWSLVGAVKENLYPKVGFVPVTVPLSANHS
jgi:hypothetical protein